MSGGADLVPVERIAQAIRVLRGERVMLDEDLAELYEVETRILTRAVRRNIERFPSDFMFQLSKDEWGNLRSQIGISSRWGGRRSLPLAFTEHGVAMLSGVLRSPRAVQVNLEIMRAFVRMRRWMAFQEGQAVKLAELEARYDALFEAVFEALDELRNPDVPEGRRIGFHAEDEA